jgi:hypothetical protein
MAKSLSDASARYAEGTSGFLSLLAVSGASTGNAVGPLVGETGGKDISAGFAVLHSPHHLH